jgi:hypothetical protein
MSENIDKSIVIRFKNLDIKNHMIINKPYLNTNNNVYNAQILYDDKPMILETPYLKTPFGVTSYQKGQKLGHSITLMSSGTYTDSHEVITKFFNELKKMDEIMLTYGEKYSEMLFNKKMNRDEIIKIYDAGVRGKLDAKGVPYPDKISPKIISNELYNETNGNIETTPKIVVFKNSQTPLEINNWNDLEKVIEKGRSLRGIIQPKVYFLKDRYGITFEYHQIKLPSIVTTNDIKLGNYALSDD